MKPVRDTHSGPGLPLFLHWQIAIAEMNGNSKFKVANVQFKVGNRQFEVAPISTVLQSIAVMLEMLETVTCLIVRVTLW